MGSWEKLFVFRCSTSSVFLFRMVVGDYGDRNWEQIISKKIQMPTAGHKHLSFSTDFWATINSQCEQVLPISAFFKAFAFRKDIWSWRPVLVLPSRRSAQICQTFARILIWRKDHRSRVLEDDLGEVMPPAREFIYFVQESGKFLEHCTLMGCTMWA